MNKVKRLIKFGTQAGWPVLLIGQPGIGKTEVCKQVASEMSLDFLTEVATTADPTDVRGLPAVVNGKADYLAYGLMRHLIETQSPTLCLIDDLGHASPEVQKSFMHLVLARKVSNYKISSSVCFVAATNDVGQKAGVSSIISPLQNRFYQVKVKPDVAAWCEWAQKNFVLPEVIAFVRSTPSLFETWKPPVGIEATCTPRTLKMLSDFIKVGASTINDYAGCIGPQIALQFAAYKDLYKEIVSMNDVISNPSIALVPKELDRKYALCAMLATQEKNWDKICVFVNRLPSEFQVLTITDATTRYPDLINDFSIKAWIRSNKEILL